MVVAHPAPVAATRHLRRTEAVSGRRPVAAREDAVFIGLGANLGDAHAQVLAAVQDCADLPDSRVLARSPLYRSAPIDADGEDYINAVLQLSTPLAALALLDALQAIEKRHGRERPYHHAPRRLDLDLLLHGHQRLDHPRLSLPHPRCHLRAFVLRPLLDIAPEIELPGLGPARHWLAGVADQRLELLDA